MAKTMNITQEDIDNALHNAGDQLDGFEPAVYKSDCIKCKHFTIKKNCIAFPSGIPLSLLWAYEKHNQIFDNQETNITFEHILQNN